jgi:hypothetical protein
MDWFNSVLLAEDDIKVAQIKLYVLQCVGLLSLGLRLFEDGSINDITENKEQDQ